MCENKAQPLTLAFFGAFTPPTRAHTDLAHLAMRRVGADRVLFIPAGGAYLEKKPGTATLFSDAERLHMLALLQQDRPWMDVSGAEIGKAVMPYTYDTLRGLAGKGLRPMLLLGEDKLWQLENRWAYVPEILRQFGLAVLTRGAERADAALSPYPMLLSLRRHIHVVPCPPRYQDISSSRARQALRQTPLSMEALLRDLPREVAAYCAERMDLPGQRKA